MKDENAPTIKNKIISEAGQIFGMGYTAKSPELLSSIADDLKAVIVDVRFSPNSRVPHWTGESLAAFLGHRYLHIREFGNLNYKSGGEIRIMNFDAGFLKLKNVLIKSNAILLCACERPDRCHRRVLAELLLENLQLKTEEVVLTGREKGTRGDQPSLF